MAAPQNWSQTPHPYFGVPDYYPLEIIKNSWFGLPFYHFRCDWDTVGTTGVQNYNFYDTTGGPADVGDRVVRWTNTYGGGIGDAYIDTSNCYYGDDAAPKLVEILIEGRPFKALGFTGKEFLAVNGEEVIQKYDLSDGPLYSTCGTIYHDEEYGAGGASFLFVVSAGDSMRNGYHKNYTQGVSPYSALLYGRYPQTNFPPFQDNLNLFCANEPWHPICPPGSVTLSDIPLTQNGGVWPSVQERGIEFWYSAGTPDNLSPDKSTWGYGGGSRTMMKFGPQGWHVGRNAGVQHNSKFIPTREENTFNPRPLNGGSDGGFLNPPGFDTWQWPDCQSTPKTGLQAILLEYDGHSDAEIVGPTHMLSGDWPELLVPYPGPTVNVYAISKEWLPGAVNDPPQGCPGFGSDPSKYLIPKYTNKDICVSPEARTNPDIGSTSYFNLMKNPHSYPAVKNQTLWHGKNLFMGGLPAVTLTSGWDIIFPHPPAPFVDGKYGHGFKGYIFEILMFEGVLNSGDKIELFNLLKAKYNKGLG